ncbi:MAG: hypothetical protein LUD72_02625 [Bacteroidales bacterium]|nr:hypothetical protein [Bacteroidales bacterium]
MTTQKQKKAVAFCERWVGDEFRGDINSFKQVSDYLDEYLDEAKELADKAWSAWYDMVSNENWRQKFEKTI